MDHHGHDVRFVPKADIMQRSNSTDYSIMSSASAGADAGPPVVGTCVRSVKSDLRWSDWYTGNSK